MDRIIFGDNQFFGVNHMSEEKGMVTARRFQDDSKVIEVIDTAFDCGVRAFSFSTHDRVGNLCNHFRASPEKYADLRLYPAIPYAQKYAHSVAEKGIVGTLSGVIFSDNTARNVVSTIARGSSLLFHKDATEMMKLLVDAEMKMFRDLNVKVVFLQNIVTDLLLGFGWKDMFISFAEYVEQRYNARAGFITLNLPRLVDLLLEAGIENPIVCAAINKVGFQMNPDVASYEAALENKPFQAMAMSILAAGAIPPKEAVEYVVGNKNIRSILFGASSRVHIEQTLELINCCR